jgi:pimeloyl-ACP methyl ester carboxylesterase
MTFLRGMVLAFALEGAAQVLWPSPSGPHAALPLYAAAFAIAARTVFWRYAAAILVLYAIGAPLLIGWSVGLALHLLAGLVAAALALAFPYRLRAGNLSSTVSLAPAEPIE